MAEIIRPSDPQRLDQQRKFSDRHLEITKLLSDPELSLERQYELKIQRVVVKYILGKDIRTEEEYRENVNSLFNEIDANKNLESYFSESVRVGTRVDSKGNQLRYQIPRSRAILEDSMAGRFNTNF